MWCVYRAPAVCSGDGSGGHYQGGACTPGGSPRLHNLPGPAGLLAPCTLQICTSTLLLRCCRHVVHSPTPQLTLRGASQLTPGPGQLFSSPHPCGLNALRCTWGCRQDHSCSSVGAQGGPPHEGPGVLCQDALWVVCVECGEARVVCMGLPTDSQVLLGNARRAATNGASTMRGWRCSRTGRQVLWGNFESPS